MHRLPAKTLAACALALLSAGCATDKPERTKLPRPKTVDGVRVELTGVARTFTRYQGLVGTAVNTGDTPVHQLRIVVDTMDLQGARGGHAVVERSNLAPGEVWEFKAMFPGNGIQQLGSVTPPQISVLR